MPAARATASAGAGRPTSTRTAGLATATATAATRTGISAVPAAGPATSTASARPAGTVTTALSPHGDFATSPFAGGSFGGMPGLSRGWATASAGHPLSFEHLAVSATPGAFGDDPFGDAPFGGDGSGNGRARATATALVGQPTSIARYNVAAARAIASRGTPIDMDALLDQATAEADRVPVFSLRVDWDGDGSFDHPLSDLSQAVEEITVNREVSTDLPDAVGLISGTAATSAQIKLGGDWQPNGPIPPIPGATSTWTTLPDAGVTLTQTVTANYVLAEEFAVTSGGVSITGLRYWRQNTTVVAVEGCLFDVPTQTEVPGTRVTFTGAPTTLPAWHTATLPTPFHPSVVSHYRVAIRFTGFGQTPGYFTSTGDGALTLDTGPLRRYSAADATGGVQGTYRPGTTLAYPTSGDSDGKLYGVDVVATTSSPAYGGNPTGTVTDPVKAFSPYRTDADLAGIPVIGRRLELRTGMQTSQGPIDLPRLTGSIASYSPSSSERIVALEGLDPVDDLRSEIVQSAWGVDANVAALYGSDAMVGKMNSQWLVDRVLRANGYFASPPPGQSLDSPTLVYSATLHGSPVAEIATYTEVSSDAFTGTLPAPVPPTWVVGDHPFSMLHANPALGVRQRSQSALRTPMICTPGTGWATSGWFRMPGTSTAGYADTTPVVLETAVGGTLRMTVDVVNRYPAATLYYKASSGAPSPSSARLSLETAGGLYRVPTNATWVFLGFHWSFTATGVTITINYNGVNFSGFAGVGPVGNYSEFYEAAYVAVEMPGFGDMSLTNVSAWYTPAIPATGGWSGSTWLPTATIDVGANRWFGLPEILAEESYSLLKEIADAEAAQFGFDETGRPYFRSRAVSRTVTTSEVLTADRALADLVVHVDEAMVRNVITINAARHYAQDWETVVEAKDPDEFWVPGLGTRWFTLTLPENCGAIWTSGTNPVVVATGDGFSDAVSNPANRSALVVAAVYYDSINVDAYSSTGVNLVFFAQRVSSRTLRLKIVNNVNRDIRFSTPNSYDGGGVLTSVGSPTLKIPGRIVKPSPVELGSLTVPVSIGKYGRRSLALGGSERLRQDLPSGFDIATAIMDWTGSPKPVLAEIEVPHNPRRKLYDQVTIVDPQGLGSVTGKLAAIRTTFSASDGARDQLLVRPNDPPPGW